MKLGQAIGYHSQVTLDGWDRANQRWVPNISKCSFKAFDQFITNRSFGQKKRMIATPVKHRIDPKWHVIRNPQDGARYLVTEENSDLRRDELYQYLYLLQIADYTAQIINVATSLKSSGMQGTPVEGVVDTVPCDMERHSATTRAGRDDVKLSLYTFAMPSDTVISTDSIIQVVDGDRFSIREVNPILGMLDVLATKYGDG